MSKIHGIIRVSGNQRCPNCAGSFRRVILKSVSNIAFRCPKCLTVPSRFYLDVHYQGDRVRIFSDKQGKPLDTISRAVDLLSHIHYEIENHIFDKTRYCKSDIKIFLFENLLQQWFCMKEKEEIVILYKYRQYGRDYFVFFKGHDVREIKTMHIHNFYHQLPVHLSSKTKKNIMSTFHTFLMWLLRMEYLEKMPVFPKIEVKQPDWQWLDIDKQDKFLSLISEEDRDIFLFLVNHGCRPSEARALKIKDVDFIHNAITICRTFSGQGANILKKRTKTKKIRVIPICNDDMVLMLKKLCSKRFGEDFVFINPRTKRYYSEDTLFRICDKVRKALGIDINLYEATRHSFASQRHSRGVDLGRIGAVLGHTDIRTTQRYSHINLESSRKIMDIRTAIKLSVAKKFGKNNLKYQRVAICE